uniref:SJCHGC08227 protein n=1 Tax=Schistosoma japonicum TaxID=6182 RepID=Q5BRH9_SCHJA|nr:SJCHGC08227 protein [Schistosoma japonicum]
MSVLAENDPGFKYTKTFLRPPNTISNRPNLSKILREAYELHTSSESNNQKSVGEKRGDFTYQLEYYRASASLKSLELLVNKP